MKKQLTHVQLYEQLDEQPYNQLWIQIHEQLGRQLCRQLEARLHTQLFYSIAIGLQLKDLLAQELDNNEQ